MKNYFVLRSNAFSVEPKVKKVGWDAEGKHCAEEQKHSKLPHPSSHREWIDTNAA